jgi:hypothetical protein
LLSGVTPWPASPETLELVWPLRQIQDLAAYRFADWRNVAVTLSSDRCASAVYSRPGQCYVVLANLDVSPQAVRCVVHPAKVPHPMPSPTTATIVSTETKSMDTPGAKAPRALDVRQLIRDGVMISIPADSTVLVELRSPQ